MLAQSKPRAEADFPPDAILNSPNAPEAQQAPEGYYLQKILNNLRNRKQHWYEYRHQDQTDDGKDEEADTDVSVELNDIAADFDLPFGPPVTPVAAAVIDEEPTFPTWLLAIAALIGVIFFIAVRNDAVIGTTRQVGRHLFKSLRR